MDKTRTSSGSSRHSQSPQPTISDIDIDNDASLSTRQIDNLAQKLPELRDSAQKYKKPFPLKREAEYYIDTSAIGRAFPDFSQGSRSLDNSGMSIEVGRGAAKENNGSDDKLEGPKKLTPMANFNFGDSLSFQDVMTSSDLFTGGPTFRKPSSLMDHTDTIKPSSRSISETRRTSGLRNHIEPSPPEKAKDLGSAESRKSSDGSRPTLAAMHARVRDENDMSMLNDQRPQAVELNVRKTRFGNGNPPPKALSNGLPKTFNASQGLQSSVPTQKPSFNLAATPPHTQHSLAVDGPNMSELLSGVYEDGTPVFSRQGKSRASINATVQRQDNQLTCTNVNDVPVPFDEQAIFLSLKLLEDKVSVLERSKAEAEVVAKHLQEQNNRLQAEKSGRRRVSQRSDSALGTTDSEGGDELTGGGQRKTAIERNRKSTFWRGEDAAKAFLGLEFSVRSLQAQLDASNRKAATAETILQSITHERDSAVSQLSLAFVTTEHLKVENEAIKEENSQLKDHITRLNNQHSNETQQWTAKETALREELERRIDPAKALNKEKNAIASSSQRNHIPSTGIQSQPQISIKAPRKTQKPYDDDSLFDLTPRQPSAMKESALDGIPAPRPQDRVDVKNTGDEALKHISEDSSVIEQGAKMNDKDQTGNESQDMTYLSFLDNREIVNLRRTIEEERLAQKQRITARHQNMLNAPTSTQEQQIQDPTQPTDASLPQPSMLKDLTKRSIQSTQKPTEEKPNNENIRRQPEMPVASTRSRRRERNTENMTSAFILPDITIRASDANTQDIPQLTKGKRRVLERLAQHGKETCTICKRTVGAGEPHDHTQRAKNNIIIPKPVPVSQRIPESALGDEDHTMRPSQPPGLALATVLKGLEDETAHLKIKVSKYQALYNGHDPSLSRRQRKSVYQKMEALLRAIDAKADQIYALYDVLEGQKQHGQQLTEEQVEVTLQSVGIDVSGLDLRGSEVDEAPKAMETARHPWELMSEASEADLPWEGIDSTVETTKSTFARASKRRSSPN